MAYEIAGDIITMPSAGDLSLTLFTFLTVPDANGRVTTCGAGANSIGVQQNKPAAIDRAVSVMTDDVSKVKCGAAVAYGDKVMSDASGRAVTATAGNHVLGIALSKTTAANQILSVLLDPKGILA